MSKVICVCNQKGGVAKTVTVCNLGVALANRGKKVLVIDTDCQGSLTTSLGFRNQDSLDVSLTTIMEKVINEESFDVNEGILHHIEGIDLMPANIELASLEFSMVNIIGRERILKNYVDSVRDEYDYVLIDTNPSLGMITINALTAADSLIIPVEAAYLPIVGLEQLIKTVGIVQRQLNRHLVIEGILLTIVENNTTFARDICELIRNAYGDSIRVFTQNIPKSIKVSEATAEGISIIRHAKNNKVAKAYNALAEEVLADDK